MKMKFLTKEIKERLPKIGGTGTDMRNARKGNYAATAFLITNNPSLLIIKGDT